MPAPDSTSPKYSAHITAETTLEPAIRAWEFYLTDQGRSPHTITAFVSDVHLLAAYLPPDRTLGNISTTDLNLYLDWLQKGRGVACSPKSLARRITSIKAFFRWLHEHGVLLLNPAEKVLQRSVISPPPVVLTGDEILAVLDIAEGLRQRAENPDARNFALLSLLLSTAIKKGECLNITTNHIDLEAPGGAVLFVRYTSPRNRYKERKISLPEDWAPAYQEYCAQYGITDKVFPWSPRRLEYLLEDLSEAAGLEKHLSFDMCRWTSALNDWLSGEDHENIRQKLGISKIQWREVRMKLERLAEQATA